MLKYYCIKQLDQNDCGAACLTTIARQYGMKISINKVREYSKTNLRGTTAAGIKMAAEKMGFSAKIIKVKNKDNIKAEFPKPGIAHIFRDNFPHFIVIHKVTRKYVIVADPSKGLQRWDIEEFKKIWSSILIVMVPNSSFSKTTNKSNGIIEKFINIIKFQKSIILNALIASLLITFLGIIGTFYYRFLIDDVLSNKSRANLFSISLIVVVLMFFKVIIEFFRKLLSNYLSQNIDISILYEYYKHVIDLPVEFFKTRKVGEIISRFNDGSKIRNALSSILLTVMIDIVMALFGGIVLYKQSNRLFLFCFVPIILYSILVLAFKKPLEYVNENMMEYNSKLTSYLIESIEGIELVKSFNAEEKIKLKGEEKFVKFIKSIFKYGYVNILQLSIRNGIKEIYGIVLLWSGAYYVLNGDMSVGTLISFNALLIYFLDPIERVINLQPEIQSAIVATKRINEVLEVEIEKKEDDNNKIQLNSFSGNIEFKDVEFSYANDKILNKINIKIESGQKVALIGESGSGKTTIAKMIMNFYDPIKGEIFLDSYNIKDVSKDAIRSNIAYISQDFFFFSGTILENLKFANENVSYEEIIDVCKKVKIHDYINSLPLRYETLLVEKGTNLSGGQRQRLSIARALLAKPKVLIMDEATSNLDSITELAIEDALEELTKNITTIIIAHRLNTIKKCDKIYVLNKGLVVEEGSHEELIKKKKSYYKLYFKEYYQ